MKVINYNSRKGKRLFKQLGLVFGLVEQGRGSPEAEH